MKEQTTVNNKRKRENEQNEDIFAALEKCNSTQFSSCVKAILKYAAYDTASSCMLLNDRTVPDVEQYIAENGRNIIENLTCCNSTTYQSQQNFRFLPGHKTTILAIPTQIREMQAMKKNTLKPMAEFKKLLTSKQLKELLLSKLEQNIVKLGFANEPLTESQFSPVETIIVDNRMEGKCRVKCFKCDVSHNLVYDGSWRLSNAIRHYKEHQKERCRMIFHLVIHTFFPKFSSSLILFVATGSETDELAQENGDLPLNADNSDLIKQVLSGKIRR